MRILGQRVAYGSVIAGEGETVFLSFDSEQKPPSATRGIERAIYEVAIASDSPVPETFSSIYEQNVTKSAGYRTLQSEMEGLQSEMEERRREIAERDLELAKRSRAARVELTSLQKTVSRLESEAEHRLARISELEAEIEDLKITRFESKRECHRIKTSLSWRLTWPLRVLRDAGMAGLRRAQDRIRALSGPRL